MYLTICRLSCQTLALNDDPVADGKAILPICQTTLYVKHAILNRKSTYDFKLLYLHLKDAFVLIIQ